MASRSLSLPRVAGPRSIGVPRLRRPRARTLLTILVVALGATGGWIWLRDSSLVAASDVTIVGVHGPQAHVIEQALRNAAGEMTTLHMRPQALRAAAAQYPLVKSIRVSAKFPHQLRISVAEHEPVAAITVAGRPVPIAEDGTILRGAYVPGLTRLRPRTPPVGSRITDPVQVAAVRILAAAPPSLRTRVTKVFMGPRGMSVRVTGAPPAIFGSGRRADAKWVSLMTLLASGKITGATQIDLSVPERPAVAGLAAPVEPQPLVEGSQ